LADQSINRAKKLSEKNLCFSSAAENVTNSGKPDFGCGLARFRQIFQ
jgi:hypothetical protein